MKRAAILRALAAVLLLVVAGWLVHHTRWEQVEVDDPARGAAANDADYSLRQVLASAGASFERRSGLEPMPPADGTLLLESSLWDIFPERDARLRDWVEHGGHLVVTAWKADSPRLRWVPLSFFPPRRGAAAPAPDDAASDAEDDDSDGDDPAPATRRRPPASAPGKRLASLSDPQAPWRDCDDFTETALAGQAAFAPGRTYRGCTTAGPLRPVGAVVSTWQLSGPAGTLAMRVPVGRGSVTGLTAPLVTHNNGLLHGDNALIAAAVLQAAPGRVVWIVGDEAREPLLAWLWHEARTPSLLALAAIALALWRLMVRFGPREAVPPRARRSMGEQVRGTGQFIAGTDPRALHAATRQALDAAARRRVQGWGELDDDARLDALARALPHRVLDRAGLRASMRIGAAATTPQILAAIAVLEQARRALGPAGASPLSD